MKYLLAFSRCKPFLRVGSNDTILTSRESSSRDWKWLTIHDPLCTILLLVLGQVRLQFFAASDLASTYLCLGSLTVGSAISQLGCIRDHSDFIQILNDTAPKISVPQNMCASREVRFTQMRIFGLHGRGTNSDIVIEHNSWHLLPQA